jgi:DNA-binding XRE family transcriptional regulator
MGARTVPYGEIKERLLQNPEVRREYESLEPAYQLARLRIAQGLSQSELAKLADTNQASISGLESGKRDVRLSTLARVVEALGYRLCFEPDDVSASRD